MPIAEDPEPRPSADDPFEGLVLDDEFVRSASVKEASGRARMLTEKWKKNPPQEPEPWRPVTEIRRSRFGRRARRLDAWGNPVRRRRGARGWQAPLFVVLAVAVTLAALNVDRLRDWYHTRTAASGSAAAAQAPVPTVAPETARPSGAPTAAAADEPTVDHPWAGSPAEGWPVGAAGFALPEAQAIGVFSADQVAAQLQLVKDYLTAANLDPAVIAGGRPDAALGLMERQQQDRATAALGQPSEEHDPTTWFSRFDPREAIQVGDAVRVQGFMTLEGDGDKGVLVHTDYTYVYPVRPGPEAAKRAVSPHPSHSPAPGASGSGGSGGSGGDTKPVGWVQPVADVAGSTATTRTIVRRVETFRFYDPARYRVDPKKIFISDGRSTIGNSACDVYDGYYHPQFRQFALPGAPEPSGPTTDPYDHSKDLPQDDGDCGSVSRT
ncbi:hypothetical protein [Kitasatospora cinereorecta]|uniref:Uncharacterized protein n=1 Tax=Kitasatospora cinereorecta TaxID=285560 RepID=A0ABW0VHX4_9ACTN